MAMRARAIAKRTVRTFVRRLGYDIVPFAGGLVDLQRQLLRQTPVVLDVGANVGQYAERLRDLGYEGRIVSFEPGSKAFHLLTSRAQADVSWEARNVALGAECGTATLQVSANSVSSSLLGVAPEHLAAAPASTVIAFEEVRLSTLDTEVNNLPGPYWLKLDVQGFELSVLKGGESALDRALAIQAELSFGDLYEDQTDWLELTSFLRDRGFKLRYVEPGFHDPSNGYTLQADAIFVRTN